jgi:hypothetical protein
MDNPQQRPRILIVDESRMAARSSSSSSATTTTFREEIDGEGGWQALVSIIRSSW